VAPAQQPTMPVIGILEAGATARPPNFPSPAFFQGLSEMGYVEGRNVAIEYRGADQYDQLLTLAADLVRRKVTVIYAGGNAKNVVSAKTATTTIPIVFGIGDDPIRAGLVPSLSRPGGKWHRRPRRLRKEHRPVLSYLAQDTPEGSAEFVSALFAMPGRMR
jgi:putative tryptophan/tyrosine transport system substrate-binding protein